MQLSPLTAGLAIFGAVIASVIALVMLGMLILLAWGFMRSAYGPTVHCGKPKLRGELAFYDRRRILTQKRGGKLTSEEAAGEPDKLDHKFAVPWFAGLSTRKGHFLFGIIRLVRQ